MQENFEFSKAILININSILGGHQMELFNAAFYGIVIALVILHFADARYQAKINKLQNRKIDKLQRIINELEEVKKWRK